MEDQADMNPIDLISFKIYFQEQVKYINADSKKVLCDFRGSEPCNLNNKTW